MIKYIFLFLLFVTSTIAYGQNKETQPETTATKEPAKEASDSTQNIKKPMDNPLVQHFSRKYSLALQWNDRQVAREALYDIIAEDYGNDSLILTLANLYYQSKSYTSSALASMELINRNPKNIMALNIAASSLENIGALEKALKHYETLYLMQNKIEVLYKMSFLQYNLERYSESKATLDILMTNPRIDSLKTTFEDSQGNPKEYTFRVALTNLKGMVYQETKDYKNARKYYEETLKMASDFALAQRNLEALNKEENEQEQEEEKK